MKYEVPEVAPNKFNMTGRVAKLETVVSGVDAAIRELTARFDRIPPKGEQGERGDKGERGPAGNNGKDGRNGKDGVGYSGPQGPSGRAGRDCECKTAIAEQHIVRLTQKLAESSDTLAAVLKQVADMQLVINALYDANEKGQQYIAWLRAKNAAKLAARKK